MIPQAPGTEGVATGRQLHLRHTSLESRESPRLHRVEPHGLDAVSTGRWRLMPVRSEQGLREPWLLFDRPCGSEVGLIVWQQLVYVWQRCERGAAEGLQSSCWLHVGSRLACKPCPCSSKGVQSHAGVATQQWDAHQAAPCLHFSTCRAQGGLLLR